MQVIICPKMHYYFSGRFYLSLLYRSSISIYCNKTKIKNMEHIYGNITKKKIENE